MSKIEKIRAEIERRHAYQKEMYSKTKPDGRPNDGWAESLAIMGELEELRNFLDTLEEEPVGEELEKEIEKTWLEYECYNEDYDKVAEMRWNEFENVARHFAEWQKQQMLKDAVEGEAEELYNDGESQCTVGVGTYFKPGEKVYVLKAMEGEE